MVATKDVKKTLVGHLRELHLPTFRECFEAAAGHALQETLSYEQYLLELAGRECEVRRMNRIARMLCQSKLPLEKSLDHFDLKPRRAGAMIALAAELESAACPASTPC